MAARKNKPLHDDKTKERIRASQLLNRLTQHANGTVELSTSQVQAARIVIGKIIPDLKAVELSGPAGGPVQVEKIVREIVDPTAEAARILASAETLSLDEIGDRFLRPAKKNLPLRK